MTAIEAIKDKLKKYAFLKIEESPIHITVYPKSVYGFTVSLYIEDNHYTVYFGESWHEEFNSESEAIDCFGFGLSKKCRLKISSRGDFPYKWTLEYLENGHWSEGSTTGLFIFPFWRRKAIRILQNNVVE